MPKFDYTSVDTDGKKRTGSIEAPSRELAEQKLEQEQLTILALSKVKESQNIEDIIGKYREIPPMTLVIFSRQLATMLDSGLTPIRSLATLQQQETNQKFKSVIGDVIAKTEAGIQMNEAIGDHPEVFDEVYTAMIRVGEETGQLDKALLTLATELEKKASIRRQVKSAMTYPKAVLGFAFVVVCGMLLTIVPKFAEIFKSAGAMGQTKPGQKVDTSLPLITQIVLDLSHLLFPEGDKTGGWFLQVGLRFIGFFIGIMLIKRVIRRILRMPGPRYRFDAFKLRAPMRIGTLVQKITMARFTRTFSSLLDAGVPPQESMEIVARTSGNKVVSEAILEARERLLAGQNIADTLSRSTVFPVIVVRMIEAGEESGNLQRMLDKIADFYEEDVEASIKGLSSIVEPLMLILIGAVIGFIIIAIYMPILTIYDKVGGPAGVITNNLDVLPQLFMGLPF